jgi:protein O-GlcNAc transferase
VTDDDIPTSLSVPAADSLAIDNPLHAMLEDAMQSANASDYSEAVSKCHETIKAFPSAAEPYFLMGTIAYICGDEGQAISMGELAHKIDPTVAEYAEALATIYTGIGRLADGLYFAKIATSLEPHPLFSKRMPPRLRDLKSAFLNAAPSTHFIEAQRLFNIGDYERALQECAAEIRLNSDNLKAYILMGRTTIILGRYSQAVGALQAAIQLDPADGLAPALLARALVHLGRHSEAAAAGKRALTLAGTDAEIYGQAMNALLRCPDFPAETARQTALDFAARFAEENDGAEPAEQFEDAPIKIGFLSNTFFNGAGHDLFLQWFLQTPAKGVSYAGYQLSVASDILTTAVKQGCESWREIFDLDPYTLSYTLAAEAMDVYVDLSNMNCETRLAVAALNPAAVRVGAFALPEPGLAPGITHVLSDEILNDADEAALLPGQQCLPVSGTLFAHAPFTGLQQDLPSPCEEKGQITFGGVADLGFLSPECATLWADVLLAVPQAHLLLCSTRPISDEVRARVREFFSMAGVANRVLLPVDDVEYEMDDHEAMQAARAPLPPMQLREIDIFLDTAPISCRRELCQALWTGVPVVSLMGERRLGRVGASILNAAGRLNWVAKDREEFVDIAAKLAADPKTLADERKALQENIGSSLLFDTKQTATAVRSSLSAVARQSRDEAKQ